MNSSKIGYTTTIIPRKFWTGKKRIAKKYFYDPLLNWALSVRVGDYICGCVWYPANVKIVKIEYTWKRRPKQNNIDSFTYARKAMVVNEITFHDEFGATHHFPGGGCATPPRSLNEIKKDFADYDKISIPLLTEHASFLSKKDAELWVESWRKEYQK